MKNPKNGMPSTLCPGCGCWNDWQKVPGATKYKWEKPHQCYKCKRQMKGRTDPGAGRLSTSDQIGIYGQRQLNQFKTTGNLKSDFRDQPDVYKRRLK